jgi:hypothetical protein
MEGPPRLLLLLAAAALVALSAAPHAVDAGKATLTLPSFCDAAPYADALLGTTMSRGSTSFKIYHNLWYHNGKWYALVDGTSNASSIEEGLSVNVGVTKLPVADIKQFTTNFMTCYVPGNTLMVDFPFPAFPDNLGHLAEVGRSIRAASAAKRGRQTAGRCPAARVVADAAAWAAAGPLGWPLSPPSLPPSQSHPCPPPAHPPPTQPSPAKPAACCRHSRS